MNMKWMKDNVGPEFFDSFRALLQQVTEKHRDECRVLNLHNGSRVNGGFTKYLSTFGAVPVDGSLAAAHQGWVDPKTKKQYIDCLNFVYATVVRAIFPKALPDLGDEKAGDLYESILGWKYLVKEHQLHVEDHPELCMNADAFAVVEALEECALSRYWLLNYSKMT